MKHFILSILLFALIGCNNTTPPPNIGTTPTPHIPNDNTLTVYWTAPTTRVDGSYLPLTDISNYNVYRGTNTTLSPTYDQLSQHAVVDSIYTEYRDTDLSIGYYFYAVTTVDINGIESEYSNIVGITLPRE